MKIPTRYDLTVDDLNAIRAEAKGDPFELIRLAFQAGFERGQMAGKDDEK